MSFINVGAYVGGQRPKSKKALREALAASPGTVFFDSTAAFGAHAGEDLPAVRLPEILGGDVLEVVGPDPYSKRNWYATVAVAGTGEHTHLVIK